MKRFLSALAALVLIAGQALGQGDPDAIINAANPPLVDVDFGAGTTWDVAPDAGGSIVTRNTGTGTIGTYVDGNGGYRCRINGNIYTVTSVTSTTEFTIDNTSVTETAQTLYMGANPAFPTDATDDSDEIQSLFDAATTSSKVLYRGAIYFPPFPDRNTETFTSTSNGYQIDTTITVENARGLRIFGGGLNWNNGGVHTTLMVWTPASVGPLFHFRGTSGLILDGINFVGNSSVGTLVKFTDGDNDEGRQSHISHCRFEDADTLIEIGEKSGSTTGSGAADMTFTKCAFQSTVHDESDRTQAAIHTTNEQALQFTFDDCQFNNLNTAIWLQFGGYVRVRGGGSGDIGCFIQKDQGSNTSGVFVENMYHDNSNDRRMIWYRGGNVGPGNTFGNIVFRGIQIQSNYPNTANEAIAVTDVTGNQITIARGMQIAVNDVISFWSSANYGGTTPTETATVASITSSTVFTVDDSTGITTSLFADEDNTSGWSVLESYSTNTLTLVDDINMMVGDYVTFAQSSDYDTLLATSVITAKTNSRTYTVADTAVELGMDDELSAGTLRAAHGTPLFRCAGGERLVVEDCQFQEWVVQAKRLAYLQTGTAGSGRDSIIYVNRCTGGLYETDASQLPINYLYSEDSQNYYRFTDITSTASLGPPVSFTNIPTYNAATAPSATDDTQIGAIPEGNAANGWAVGAIWVDTNTNKVYAQAEETNGAAVWTEITQAAGQQQKLDATVDPTANNDNTEGYGVGSIWANVTGDRAFICVDASTGGAKWREVTYRAPIQF